MLSRMATVAAATPKSSILYSFRLLSSSVNASNPTVDSSKVPIANISIAGETGKPPAGVHAYPHDAPERDFVNFPPYQVREESGKTRAWIIPEEWCQALYAKTGVTGPYVLFWGAVITALSKEYYVASVDFGGHVSFILMCAILAKYAGPQIKKYLDNEADKMQKAHDEKHSQMTRNIVDKIEELDSLGSLTEANALVHAAKKENVQLQLEAEYRERMMQVYNDVKKRLDYQVAIQNAYKRIEREQAINYINGEVARSIGATQEKEAFQTGLETLKALSKKYAGSI